MITPPLSEQLALLLSISAHPFSRTLLIEGASHFSPIRVEGQFENERGDDLFQLGEELVGVKPLLVQSQLALEIIKFLVQIEKGNKSEAPLHQQIDDLRLHLLDRYAVKELLKNQ